MKAFSTADEIDRIGRAFLDRSLPKSEWTHAGHFAASLWLLRHRPALTSAEEMRRLIRAYNDATGTANTDQGGYHETITRASMRAAAAFLADHPHATPLDRIANALLASPLGDKDWLLEYWTRALLFGVAARRDWIDPYLRALPW